MVIKIKINKYAGAQKIICTDKSLVKLDYLLTFAHVRRLRNLKMQNIGIIRIHINMKNQLN